MTRYFYTDPLAAAWMAKHFGMKFISAFHRRGDGWREYNDELAVIESCTDLLSEKYDPNHKESYYIQPDSEHLLEPQIGDLALCESDDPTDEQEAVFYLVNYDPKIFDVRHGIFRIIQRNGIPFMWPERDGNP